MYVACADMSIVRRCANKPIVSEAGTSDLWDNPRPGRPVTATNKALTK